MTLARLFVAALLLCGVSAVAQQSLPGQSVRPGDMPLRTPTATTSEPWRIIPDQPLYSPGQNSQGDIRIDQYKADPASGFFKQEPETTSSLDDLPGDTCFTIRSYVMARDDKDSDSTHLAGYSTCQPSSRYRMKKAEVRSATVER
jgi:hypothetical protein